MRSDDLFWIASMTKPITATGLMMLVDEGKVNLADPVQKYLPEFKGQLVAEGNGPPHPPSHPITVREIMSHTSGLVRASDPVFRKTDTLADWVARCGKTPLIREPGTKYEYNNSGINTGGRIIEVVSGLPYTEFMRRRIFDPLGMKDTTFWPSEAQAARLRASARRSKDSASLEEIQLAKNVTPALIERLGHGTKVPAPMLDDMGIGQIANYAFITSRNRQAGCTRPRPTSATSARCCWAAACTAAGASFPRIRSVPDDQQPNRQGSRQP